MSKIKEGRLKKGYTQQELAKIVGVSQPTIYKWEKGKIENMTNEHIRKLCEVLDITTADVIGVSEFYKPIPMSEYEETLLQMFNEMTPKNRIKLLRFAMDMLEEQVGGLNG